MGDLVKLDSDDKYLDFLETGIGEGLDFRNVIFEKKDFRGVNLRKACLRNVTFKNCNLMFSDFYGASFFDIKIVNTPFNYSNFEKSALYFSKEFLFDSKNSFWGSNFTKARLLNDKGYLYMVKRDIAVRRPQSGCPEYLSRINWHAKKKYQKLIKNKIAEESLMETAKWLEANFEGNPRNVVQKDYHDHFDQLAFWWTSRGLVPPWALMRH